MLQKCRTCLFSGRLKSNSHENQSSGMFSPLVGNEQEERLRNKYDDEDADNFDVKAEQLSRNLFQKNSKNHTKSTSSPLRRTDEKVKEGKGIKKNKHIFLFPGLAFDL